MKTFIQKIALTLTFILSIHLLQGQYHLNCTNLDFSNSNFQNWTCKTASNQGVASTAYENLTWEISPNPINGRHNIMTNIYGYDPNTCNGSYDSQLSLIPDGFTKSARIGSGVASHHASAIEYKLAVDEDNALLLMHYAIVFQNAGHDSSQQARFEIRIQDSLGNLLNTACNHYVVIADKNNPDFKQCGTDVLWQNWSTMGINLNPFIGQTICISISITNCACENHYGYAYVVGECMPMKVNLQNCCINSLSTIARLEAPDGFIAYEWSDNQGNIVGKNQILTILRVPSGTVFTVSMLSKMGCVDTLSCEITCDSTSCEIICDSTTYKCYPTKVVLTALPYSQRSTIGYWEWTIFKTSENKGTEHVSSDSIFEYTFQDTGHYRIFLTIYTEEGCADTASVIVYSYPSYGKVNITAPDKICNHIETEVFASGAEGYEWYDVKRIASDSSAIIDKGGTYVIKGINTLGCSMDTFTVADKIFTIQYTKENNKCPKLSDGKINITKVVGGYDGSVLHYWEDLGFTNGAVLSERDNLLSDQYIVYSIDEDNCYRYDTIEITEPLPLGNIGKISGPFIVSNIATYTFSVSPVQGTELYHWYAYEIKESGRLKILDTFINTNQVDLSISDINPIEISVRAFNFCGDTTDVSSLYIQYKSDIVEATDSKHIVVYPNPTSDYVTIQHKNGTLNEIRIFDVIGKEIKRQIVSGSVCTLNTENLHSGIYFIQIKTESGITTTKVYKK